MSTMNDEHLHIRHYMRYETIQQEKTH